MRLLGLIVVLALGLAGVAGFIGAVAHAADGIACNQAPGDRFFWVERAFCDLEMAGPGRAQGVIIWNHGIRGSSESWKAPVPPALRLLQRRGWDVIAIKRHHLAETMPGGPLHRTVRRTLEEAGLRKRAGYAKVALAGQSFGGYVTLEAIDASPDLDAAIAFAPGVRAAGPQGALDPTIVERILKRARVGRLALVFPRNDDVFGNVLRGERAGRILATRDFPWWMVDESAHDVTGHGAAITSDFAIRYGNCLSEFLRSASLPAGRFTCPPGADAPGVQEILAPRRTLAPPR